MTPRTALRRAAATAALSLAALAGVDEARAGGYCPPPCGHYEYVKVIKTVDVPYTTVVTLYDHCGRPYSVEKTGVRTVEVSVKKRVFVYE